MWLLGQNDENNGTTIIIMTLTLEMLMLAHIYVDAMIMKQQYCTSLLHPSAAG